MSDMAMLNMLETNNAPLLQPDSLQLDRVEDVDDCELTILMPCLNEAETLAICVKKAKRFLSEYRISGEVLIADNGSIDGSQRIAESEGGCVVPIARRGYGAALLGGIDAARGRYIIMGDADDSYDFSALASFVERLRSGADLVMGNRFRGGIAPGAMPFLHKYLGNPVLSGIGKMFFKIRVNDFHCGLRGFNRNRIKALKLRTTGMEFASEMVVRAAISGYRLEEVATTLKKDGRSRPPHLRTWRDGWRHLSFLLMYSPKWLFLYPGVALIAVGLLLGFALLPGPVFFGEVGIDIHTFMVASFMVLMGFQAISFAAAARRFGSAHGLLPPPRRFSLVVLDMLTLDRMLIGAGILAVLGLFGIAWCVVQWAAAHFGPLEYGGVIRILVISLTAIAIGVQSALTAFLAEIMVIPTR
jgi:glycosyltransferase involved in cell wall biosynthesis